jgi:hypothetical protein
LLYREVEPPSSKRSGSFDEDIPAPSRSDAFNYLLPAGLVKKAISIPAALRSSSPKPSSSERSFHLVHYFRPSDVSSGALRTPSTLDVFNDVRAHALRWAEEEGLLITEEGTGLELSNEEFSARMGPVTRRAKSGDVRSPTEIKQEVGSAVGHVSGTEDVFAAERQRAHRKSHTQSFKLPADAHARQANTPILGTGMPVRPRSNSLQYPTRPILHPHLHPHGQVQQPQPSYGKPGDGRFLDSYMDTGFRSSGVPEFAFPDVHFDGVSRVNGNSDPGPRRSQKELHMRAAEAAVRHAENFGALQVPQQQQQHQHQNAPSPLAQLVAYFDNTLNPSNLLASPVMPSQNVPTGMDWSDRLERPMMQPYPNFPSLDALNSPDAEMDVSTPGTVGRGSFFPDLVNDDPMMSGRNKRNHNQVGSSQGSRSGGESDSDKEGWDSREATPEQDPEPEQEPMRGQSMFPPYQAPPQQQPGYDWFATNFAAAAAEAAAMLHAKAPNSVGAIPLVRGSPAMGNGWRR